MEDGAPKAVDGFAWGRTLFVWLLVSLGLMVALSLSGSPAIGWLAAILWSALVFAALLGLSEKASREHIASSLESPGIERGYAISTHDRLERLWTRYAYSGGGAASLRVSIGKAMTWKLYDAAMLVAVIYPTLVIVGWWIVTGRAARLGDALILPDAHFWPDRAISLIGMMFYAVSLPLAWKAESIDDPARRNLGRWLPVIGATIATAGILSAFNALAAGAGLALGFLGGAAIAGVGSIVVVGAAAIVGAAAVSIATASTMMGVGLAPIGIAIALVVVMGVTLDTLDAQGRQPLARLLITVALPVGWIITLLMIPWPVMGARARGLFLFLAVFPLINAIVSFFSYAAVLGLARHGYMRNRILLNGLLGLIVGIVLSALLGIVLTLTVALLDTIVGGDTFRLWIIFAEIALHPEAQVWLLLTLLTPIAPFVIHSALALIGETTIVPKPLRERAAALVRDAGRSGERSAAAITTPFILGTFWILPFVLIGVIGWAVATVSGAFVQNALWSYVFAVRDIAYSMALR